MFEREVREERTVYASSAEKVMTPRAAFQKQIEKRERTLPAAS